MNTVCFIKQKLQNIDNFKFLYLAQKLSPLTLMYGVINEVFV